MIDSQKPGNRLSFLRPSLLALSIMALPVAASAQAKDIIYDSEFQLL